MRMKIILLSYHCLVFCSLYFGCRKIWNTPQWIMGQDCQSLVESKMCHDFKRYFIFACMRNRSSKPILPVPFFHPIVDCLHMVSIYSVLFLSFVRSSSSSMGSRHYARTGLHDYRISRQNNQAMEGRQM